ncbi:hypothetical protein [Streptomyces sp. NPDC096153]|uniref:hypothetical protein n=1 Tax=Streptomyces sp. NPDC096153 TaxID=3155548 RepID=UPI003319C872
MSARMGLYVGLCLRHDHATAHERIEDFRVEVLHETPLFLAEYDSVESEVHLTLDDARAMCDDITKAVADGQCWDWSRNEDGVWVQFWTHEDDDRPLHVTGGTVTEIRVQRRDAVPAPRLVSATPLQVEEHLATVITEDAHLRYQQALCGRAVEMAARDIRMDANKAMVDGAPRALTTGALNAADSIDPMRCGPLYPTKRITFARPGGETT